MNIAIIPARGGSKRIPKKNIKIFNGKPMIYWAIRNAINSNCFDRIIVSTDDNEIASIAKKYNAEVPFKRPKNLADDYTLTQDVIKHCLDWLNHSNYSVENVCCIYPATPLINKEDILKAKKILEISEDQISVFSATKFPYPIERGLLIDENGYSRLIKPDLYNKRSQDCIEAYHDAGQFYWASKIYWNKMKNIFHKSKPYLIPSWRVQDIDNNEDWRRAEIIFDLLQKYQYKEDFG